MTSFKCNYCNATEIGIEVPGSWFTVRQNGIRTFMCGSCHDLFQTIKLSLANCTDPKKSLLIALGDILRTLYTVDINDPPQMLRFMAKLLDLEKHMKAVTKGIT